MRYSDLSAEQFGLVFDVIRGIRYHNRRRTTFERLHKTTNIAAIITAGFAFLSLSAVEMPAWSIWLAALSALLSCTDLVVGFSRMADLHREFARRFCKLEQDILAALPADPDLRSFQAARLEIERDEPPVYRVLDLLCYRETFRALGCDPATDPSAAIRLRFYHHWTAGLLHWTDIASSHEAGPAQAA